MKLDPDALDAAAKAMYEYKVSEARKAVDNTKFDASAMPDIFRRLHRDSETSQVLVVSSYLEDRILTLLQYQMVDLESESSREKMFGSNGPLGTFGGRITMAYHLGWLSKDTVDNLNNFRKIRNIFAHKAFNTSYDDHRVRALFTPLILNLERFDSTAVVAAMGADRDNGLIRVADATVAQRYLCSLALLTGDVCRELLVMPAALRHQVSARAITGKYDEGPQVLRELGRNMVRCALEILATRPPS
ncbi:hypothetical protein ASC75_08440 [Aminobacter sp. DSM 101952]|uniref:hypothetical protein n=1 Tax=Aminobacter sp. DSM 101952 TaxID=2735891 RepID=UPI0006FC1306|nr:hypothetical protein [Aminobacter sp. DSM 101952]KQU66655.1 hypothetical protein ASC75_08440 [Aminobacter sp. DSM 101952]